MQSRMPDLMAPREPDELVKRLRETMPVEEAVMAAWDVWRAGVAWDRERASYWLVRHAAGFANPDSERAWRRRATDWGVRVLEPTETQREPCARIEPGGVRLGLDALPRRRRRRWRNPAVGWLELARAILHGVAYANLPVRGHRSKSFRFT
jgi:hypothetical protein